MHNIRKDKNHMWNEKGQRESGNIIDSLFFA